MARGEGCEPVGIGERKPVPGYRNYLIYADETGIDGQVYYAFGSIWIPYEARGRLTGLVGELRERHGVSDEIKWENTSRRKLPFYRDIVEEFFKRNWLMFHCIVVRRSDVNRSLHASIEEAREKHFERFIRNKLTFFAGSGGKAYHLRIDPFPSPYPKTDEKLHKIANASAKKALGYEPLASTWTVKSSKTSAGVQVADLLLGAILSDWQGKAKSEAKLELRRWVAEHLGWPDLKHDTFPQSADPRSWKFNIWLLWKSRGVREIDTRRKLRFKYPVRPYRP